MNAIAGLSRQKRAKTSPRKSNIPKRKRTNSRWSSMGINYPANRPDPDDPGGLGAEESGAERTGPTQDYVVATQRGGRLAEVGRYYDSANDPVTACFRSDRRFHRPFRRAPFCVGPKGTPLRRRAVGATMPVSA